MSGDSRVFPPLSVPSLTFSAPPGGTFTPNVSTSLSASVSQTSPYSLILPATLPSSTNQALLSDTSGNLSWGTVSSGSSSSPSTLANYGTFSAAAPQATPVNVTGLIGSNTLTALNLIVNVNATTKIYVVYSIQLYQKGSSSSWGIVYNAISDTDDTDTGIVFTVTNAGQVQYTSPSYSGWVSTTMNWYASYTVASTLTSQVTNTFSGASNVSTATAITGLVVPTGTNQLSVNVFVSVKATTNLSALVTIMAYLNATGTAYSINTTNTGDNVGISWSVNASGQILYTSTTYAGFQSMQLTWTTPFTVSTTATTLSSLALSGSLSVGTNTLLAQNPSSGTLSSVIGALVHVGAATYTDTGTAASSTANGNFSGTYLAAPILAATNTAVTNPSASTLTISGPPTAGNNTSITNAYAVNVLNGNVNLGNGFPIVFNLPTIVYGSTNTNVSLSSGNSAIPSSYFSITSTTGISMGTSGSNVVTIGRKGQYAICLQINVTLNAAGTIGAYVLGSNNIYYALNYGAANLTAWVQCFADVEIPSGVTLTPYVYVSGAGSLTAVTANLGRFTVTGHTMTN